MIESIHNTALTGIQTGLSDLQKNASQIASKASMEGKNTQSLTESLVDIKTNGHQVSASAKLLSVTDGLIGTLLDIKA